MKLNCLTLTIFRFLLLWLYYYEAYYETRLSRRLSVNWLMKMLHVWQRRSKPGFILKEMETCFHWAVVEVLIVENAAESSCR